MHIILNANMVLISSVQMNGSDMSPLRLESFGRMGKGPWRKNFVIPNELETILLTRVIRGRA